MSVSPTDGIPTLVRVFLCPYVGPIPLVGLTLTWSMGRKLALHITFYHSLCSKYMCYTANVCNKRNPSFCLVTLICSGTLLSKELTCSSFSSFKCNIIWQIKQQHQINAALWHRSLQLTKILYSTFWAFHDISSEQLDYARKCSHLFCFAVEAVYFFIFSQKQSIRHMSVSS